MKKRISNLWNSYKNKQESNRKQEEMRAFNITEKDGNIYIIAGMKAIKVIDSYATAYDIVKALNECREAQLQFNKKSDNNE